MYKFFFQLFLLLSIVASAQESYWQQDVAYDIKVDLADKNHLLRGFEEITYTNQSPDTLNQIYIHCWPNAYSSSLTPLAKQLKEMGNTLLQTDLYEYKGYIDSLDFKVNDKEVNWLFTDLHNEIALIQLKSSLLPGETIVISTPFRVKIPTGEVSRLGHIGQSYQITQWYPKPAVYDQNGWHPMPYLSQGEFYSEFADFDVKITLPDNYLVASTGNLTPASEQKEHAFLAERLEVTKEILNKYPYREDKYIYYFPETGQKASSETQKTLHFKENEVHDFAWFADKNWLVTKEQTIIPGTFKSVDTWAYFLPQNMGHWRNAQSYIDKALDFYSYEVGPYPFNHITAVDGALSAGAGMEYPKITVIGELETEMLFEETLIHEIGHNWFYGMLASNERNYPWMDEGMNSYFELKYFEQMHPDKTIGDFLGGWIDYLIGDFEHPQRTYYYLAYIAQASRNIDQPVDLFADEYTNENYPSIVYAKSALIFRYLQEYLGEEMMREIFHAYFKEYKNKHTYPKDFWLLAEDISGKNLSWVYDESFGTNQLDYAVKSASVNYDSKEIDVLVKNSGKVKGPLSVTVVLEGQPIKTYWFEGFEGERVLNLGKVDGDKVVIDYFKYMPEINRNNNEYKLYGLLGGVEPVKFFPFVGIDHSSSKEVFVAPMIGYNHHDKFKIGFVAHNLGVKEKKFRFLSSPNFGFGSNNINGSHQLVYSFYPNKYFRKINTFTEYRNETFSGDAALKRQGRIEKYEAGTQLFFKKSSPKSHLEQTLKARYTAIKFLVFGAKANVNEYLTLTYDGDYKSTFNPFSYQANAQLINGELLKFWGSTEFNFTVSKTEKRTIDLRLFGGFFANTLGPDDQRHRLRLTAHNGAGIQNISNGEISISGMTDYLMDEVYVGRYVNNVSNIASQQIAIEDGAFRTGINYGVSSTWLTSANLTLPTPSKYFSAFADFGLFGSGNEAKQAYVTGFQINIIKDVFELYFPLINSSEIEANFTALGVDNYFQKVRFMLDLKSFFRLVD